MPDSFYKSIRKKHDLTQEDVCSKSYEMGEPIPIERLRRIENGKFRIKREEVKVLSEIYGEPILRNYYCSQECPLGKDTIPSIKVKDLSQIVLEVLNSVNSIKNRQERLIEITVDGIIDDEEIKDFIAIKKELDSISVTIETLKYWVEEMLEKGLIDIEKYNALQGE